MKTGSLVALVLLLVTAPAVLADTAAQRAACTSDVFRLCSPDIPDVGAIKSCLRREKPRLSAACRTVMDTADTPAMTVAAK